MVEMEPAGPGGSVTLTPEQIASALGLSPGRVILVLTQAGVPPVRVKGPGRGRAKYTFRAEDLRPWVEGRLRQAEREAEPWRRLLDLVSGDSAAPRVPTPDALEPWGRWWWLDGDVVAVYMAGPRLVYQWPGSDDEAPVRDQDDWQGPLLERPKELTP